MIKDYETLGNDFSVQDNVRMQDCTTGLVGCTSSREGRDLVWKFLQENWKMLVERFGEKSSFLIYFVEVKSNLILFN